MADDELVVAGGGVFASVTIRSPSITAKIKLNVLLLALGTGTSNRIRDLDIRRGSSAIYSQSLSVDPDVLTADLEMSISTQDQGGGGFGANFEDWVDEPGIVGDVTYSLVNTSSQSRVIFQGSYLMAEAIG